MLQKLITTETYCYRNLCYLPHPSVALPRPIGDLEDSGGDPGNLPLQKLIATEIAFVYGVNGAKTYQLQQLIATESGNHLMVFCN